MAAPSIDSAFAPASERMTATASNSTEGRTSQLSVSRQHRAIGKLIFLHRRIGYFVERKTRSDPVGEICFDMSQVTGHRLAHVYMFDLGTFKH